MKFNLLAFPAIAQQDEEHVFRTPFDVRTVRRREGEALHPDREPLSVLEQQKILLGTRYFSGQYLQAPVPIEGNLVKHAWFRRYHPLEIAAPDRVIQSWDTAAKAGQLNDYSVCTTWALKGERIYLIDVVRERLEFPALKRRVMDEADRHKADVVLIEDKGSGTGLLQELQASGFWKGRAFLPQGDKILRLASVTAMIEQGRVYLPHAAVWLEDYLHELCGFPGLKHDDQVDSTSQALSWIREEGNPGGLYHFYRQENERRIAFSESRTVQLRAPAGRSHFSGMDGVSRPISSDGTIWLTEQDTRAAVGAGFVRIGQQPPLRRDDQGSGSWFS